MQPAQSPTPEPAAQSGMWAPYEPPEIGEPLDTLDKVGPFVLLAAKVRDAVEVTFDGVKKMREPVDLTVATTETGVVRTFSGFSAGIVGAARRVTDGDLPAVCRIVETATGRGKTRGLELVQLLPAGVDVGAIAKAQPVPIAPIQAPGGDDIPY